MCNEDTNTRTYRHTYKHTYTYIYIIIIIIYPLNSSYQRLLVVFQWGLSDSKSPQVSRILLIILADLSKDLAFHLLLILLRGQPGQQSSKFCKFPFVVVAVVVIDYYKVSSSG